MPQDKYDIGKLYQIRNNCIYKEWVGKVIRILSPDRFERDNEPLDIRVIAEFLDCDDPHLWGNRYSIPKKELMSYHKDFGELRWEDDGGMPSKLYKYAKVPDNFHISLNDKSFWAAFHQAERETQIACETQTDYFAAGEDKIRRVIGDFTTRLRRNLMLHPRKQEFSFLFNTNYWYEALQNKTIWPHYNSVPTECIKMLDTLSKLYDSGVKNDIDELRKDLRNLSTLQHTLDDINQRLTRPTDNIINILEEIECPVGINYGWQKLKLINI